MGRQLSIRLIRLINMIEKQSGRIFDLIMNELEGANLNVLEDTVIPFYIEE